MDRRPDYVVSIGGDADGLVRASDVSIAALERLVAEGKQTSKAFFDAKQRLDSLQAALAKQSQGSQAFKFLEKEVASASREVDRLQEKLSASTAATRNTRGALGLQGFFGTPEEMRAQAAAVQQQAQTLFAGLGQAAAAQAERTRQQAVTLFAGIGDAATAQAAKTQLQARNLFAGIAEAAAAQSRQAREAMERELARVRPARKLDAARDVLGLPDPRKVEQEVARIEGALKRLRNSGTLTAAQVSEANRRAADRIKEVRGQVETNGRRFTASIDGIRAAVLAFGGAFIFKNILDASIDAERTQKLLEQRLRSTGRAAEFSAQELLENAQALQLVTSYGDEAIAQVETALLGYNRVGREVMPRATEAALDLSEALGKDLSESAEIVGKALQAPEKASKALRAAKILLTDAEVKNLKAMMESGRVAEAQETILKRLEGTYANTARAARDTFGGALSALKEAAGDLLEGDGGNLNDATESINNLTDTLRSPEVKQGFQTVTGLVLDLVSALAQIPAFSKWLGTELGEFAARAIHGPGDSDSIRKEIDSLNKALAQERTMNARSPRRNNQRQLELENEIRLLEEKKKYFDTFEEGGNPKPSGSPKASTGTPSGGDPPDLEDAAAAKKAAAELKARLQAQIQAANSVLRAEQERAKAALDQDLEDSLVGYREYHARKLQMEQEAISAEISQRQTLLKTADAAERIRLQGEIDALRIQREEAAKQSAREVAAVEKQLAEEQFTLRQRLLEATGQGAQAQREELEREFKELTARLVANADMAGMEMAQKLFNAEKARIELDEVAKELDDALSTMQAKEQRLAALQEVGFISDREARKQVIQLHLQTADVIDKLIPRYEALARAVGDKEALARIEELKTGIISFKDTTSEAARAIEQDLRGSFSNAINAILEGTSSGGDILKNLWKDIMGSINRQVSQDLGDMAVDFFKSFASQGASAGAAGSTGGAASGGGIFAQAASWLAGFFHTGGIVGQEGRRASVPSVAFARAPRMHEGGVAGAMKLRPDEVPAILQKGEGVFTKEQMKNMGGNTNVNVVVHATDAGSFKRSEDQIGAQMYNALQRARLRNT